MTFQNSSIVYYIQLKATYNKKAIFMKRSSYFSRIYNLQNTNNTEINMELIKWISKFFTNKTKLYDTNCPSKLQPSINIKLINIVSNSLSFNLMALQTFNMGLQYKNILILVSVFLAYCQSGANSQSPTNITNALFEQLTLEGAKNYQIDTSQIQPDNRNHQPQTNYQTFPTVMQSHNILSQQLNIDLHEKVHADSKNKQQQIDKQYHKLNFEVEKSQQDRIKITDQQPSSPNQVLKEIQYLNIFAPKQVQLVESITNTYKFKVQSPKPSGDLYFTASSKNLDPSQEPILKVKKRTQQLTCIHKPTSSICSIPQANFQETDLFQLQVTCSTNCTLILQVYFNAQMQVVFGEEILIGFHIQGAAVTINSKIPTDIGEFSEIIIQGTVENPYQIKQGFSMKASAGNNLKGSTIEVWYTSVGLWFDGQGIFLDSDKAKPGNQIRVIIYGTKGLALNFSIYKKAKNTMSIPLNEDIYDQVNKSIKYYDVDISSQLDVDKSTIYIKLLRYSGLSNLIVYTNTNRSQKVQLGGDKLGSNHYFLTSEQRKAFSMSNNFSIGIQSDGIATYKLLVEIDNKGFTQLENNQPEFATLEKNEVDNFIYITRRARSTDNNLSIRLNIHRIQGFPEFGVKKCSSYYQDQTYRCIYNSSSEFSKNDFSQISGTYRNYTDYDTTQFSFQYDIQNCPIAKGKANVHQCAFLIVLTSQEKSTYTLTLSESANEEKILQESVPYRDRLSQMKYNYYRFSLLSLENVVGVNFFLSTISGDCVLVGSTTKRFPQLVKGRELDDTNILSHMYYIKFNQTADAYYVSVFAYDESYYTITAVVTRKNSDNETIISALNLFENIPSINYINESQGNIKFLISGFVGESLFVEIEQIQGWVWFQINKADRNWVVIQNSNWKSTDGWIQVVQSSPQTPTNYIVSVRSNDAIFSIQYAKKGSCIINRFSKPIHIMLSPNSTRCYSYQINDLEDIQITTSIGNYDGGINNLNITLDINGTIIQLNQSSKTISALQWIQYCPNLKTNKDQNKSTCFLKLYATSYLDIYFTIVAQYENEQILLIDGVYQRVKAQMSNKKPRHYYFPVDWQSSISVFLKSFTDSKYILNARIVSWKQYLSKPQDSVYPLFNQNRDISSSTNSLKTTSMIVSRQTLDKYNCNYNCVLLISVYSQNTQEESVHFDLEVSQTRGFLYSGDAKLGFVEPGSPNNYDIKTSLVSQSSKLTLKIQPFTQNCAITTIRYRLENKQQYQEQEIEVVNNIYVIQPHQDDRIYTIEVNAKTTCSYQISLLESNGYLTLISGVSFDIAYQKNQQNYYLYHHNVNQNIYILAMAEFGSLKIQATPLSVDQLSNITNLTSNKSLQMKYLGYSSTGSLTIDSSQDEFCQKCYYLIKITAITKASADLIVYPDQSAVQIRSNKIINQKIKIGGFYKTYRFHSAKTFYINVDLTVGQAIIKVQRKVDGKVIYNSVLSGSRTILVKANNSLQDLKDNDQIGWNLYGQVYTYEISILPKSEQQAVTYSIVIRYQNDPLRLRQGIPLTINQNQKNKCATFTSFKSQRNGYLILTMKNTSQFSYILSCNTNNSQGKIQTCENGSNILVKETRNSQNINAQIRMIDGIYSFCASSIKPISYTILYTQTDLIHLQPDKELLIQQVKTTQSFNVYNPNLEKVMIQLFQCKGKVGLMTTSNYSQLEKSQNPESKIIIEKSKIAGHYISIYQPYDGQQLEEVFTSVIPQTNIRAGLRNSTYIIKYSHYIDQNPYKSIQPDSLDVQYDITQNDIVFRVEKIVNYGGYFSKTKNNYTLLISNNLDTLNGISNCQLEEASISASYLLDSDPEKQLEVAFSIPLADISQKFGDKYFYATVSAKVASQGFSKSNHTHFYKVIYSAVQVNPNFRTIMDKSNSQLKLVFVWIVIPTFIALIALIIACRYCLRGWMYNPVRDSTQFVQQNPNLTIDPKKNIQLQNPSTGTLFLQPQGINPQNKNQFSSQV